MNLINCFKINSIKSNIEDLRGDKMKKKYYLRGLGTGIILATIIMLLGSSAYYKSKLTDEEIIARAKKLGMVVKEDKSSLDELLTTITPSPSPAAKDGKDKSETNKESEVTSTLTPTIAPTSVPEQESKREDAIIEVSLKDKATQVSTKEESAIEATETINASTQSHKVDVNITQGMSSEVVAKMLKSKGIINDSKDFNKYLIAKGYTRIIGVGNFLMETNLSYDKIADLIIIK